MRDLSLDQYAHLPSPIHRWDARYKLIGLFGLMFAFSFVQQLRLLPLILLLTLIIFRVSRLPFPFLLQRLRYPGVFLLAVAALLPLFSGATILLRLGPLAVRQEGLLALLLIGGKFVAILTLAVVLFGSAPFLTTIKALRALRLSPILADMLLLTYRYLFEIGHDLQTMERAMRLRHFQPGRFSLRGLRALAALAGTLLVRSYERSERVYQAMILRGYGAGRPGMAGGVLFQAGRADVLATGGVLALAAIIVALELYLRRGG